MEDFLIVILSIPLIGKSLQMGLHNIYTLPALHLEHKAWFSFILEGEYLALSTSGTYAAMPILDEINICLATQGHLCVPNTAHYPVEEIEWCTYDLFIKAWELIHIHCLVYSHTQHICLALSLDGYIWAVSSLATKH